MSKNLSIGIGIRTTDMRKIGIVILNWNGWRDTIECLESIQRVTYPNYQIILVDNGSTDDSIEQIEGWAQGRVSVASKFIEYNPSSKPIHVIKYQREWAEVGRMSSEEVRTDGFNSNRELVIILSNKNLGFAGGNNLGIKYSLANGMQYVLLLNNDTVVDPKMLEALIATCNTHDNIGIATGKILQYHKPNVLWYAGGELNLIRGTHIHKGEGQLDRGQFDHKTYVSFASGCFMLIKNQVFCKIGLLPEKYFLGAEDYEYCWRTKRAGFGILYIPEARIWHKVGASRRVHSFTDIYYYYTSKLIFMHSVLKRPLWCIWVSIWSICASIVLPWMLYNRNKNHHPNIWLFYKVILISIKDGITKSHINYEDLVKFERYIR